MAQIGYVCIGSNDFDRACSFYDALTAELGGKRLFPTPHGQMYRLGSGAMIMVTDRGLAKDPALVEAMGAVLRGEGCPDRERFYRLRSAGLILGASPADARPRCGLYRQLMPAAT